MPAEGVEVINTPTHQGNQPAPEQGGDDVRKELEAIKADHAKTQEQFKELQSRYADADQRLREFGKTKKQFEAWQQRVKEEPDAVLREMGGDPVLAAARVIPEMNPNKGEDHEPPSWFKSYAEETNRKIDEALSYQKQEQQKATHYSRVGQLQAFLGQEGVADQHPLIAMLGAAGLDQVARVMAEREERDGVPPNPADILKEQEKFLDRYNDQTTKMWAKNKITAKRMVEALQAEGYSIHSVGPRLTLMNEDDAGISDGVDVSKLSGDALIKYNMEMAERRAAAEAKGR